MGVLDTAGISGGEGAGAGIDALGCRFENHRLLLRFPAC
jgi:hypothetical protein